MLKLIRLIYSLFNWPCRKTRFCGSLLPMRIIGAELALFFSHNWCRALCSFQRDDERVRVGRSCLVCFMRMIFSFFSCFQLLHLTNPDKNLSNLLLQGQNERVSSLASEGLPFLLVIDHMLVYIFNSKSNFLIHCCRIYSVYYREITLRFSHHSWIDIFDRLFKFLALLLGNSLLLTN